MMFEGQGNNLIDGRFELLDRLGGGGMGLVWRARDTMLQREVALKEVRSPDSGFLDNDPTAARIMRERVLREAQALARLHHPNVVTIYHIVDRPDLPHPWLVMELVQGGSLHDRLARGPLAPAEAAALGRGVLSALRAADAAGIQHRDVKPANVLLRPDGTPVLTDFGIAALREATTELTATGALIGSPEYIAPERIRGDEGSLSADLWSLGMLIYVAVEGQHPLRRSTTLATLAAVLDEPIPPPLRCGPLAPVLGALLQRDPAARPDAARLDQMLFEVEHSSTNPAQFPGGYSYPYAQSQPQSQFQPGAYSYPQDQPLSQSQVQSQAQSHAYLQSPAQSWQPADARPTGPSDFPGEGWTGSSTKYGENNSAGSPHRAGNSGPRGKVVFVSCVAATAAVGLIGALAWSLGAHNTPGTNASGSNSGQNGAVGTHSSSIAPVQSGPAAPVPTAAAASTGSGQNLLTVAGMKAVVSALKPVMGGTRVTGLTVYPEYADADAPKVGDSTEIDEYEYRDGVASWESADGTADPDDGGTVDLATIDWSILPALLADANQDLKVPDPNTEYIIVNPDWLDEGPALQIYLANDYGGGYLAANLKGQILKTYPFGS